jgi:hypothetical protein
LERLLVSAFVFALTATAASPHEWYSGQKNAEGEGCCGGQDCAPIPVRDSIRRTATGYDVVLYQNDLPALADFAGSAVFHFKGNPGFSPDGFVHACVAPADIPLRRIRCLFMGGAS